MSQPPTGAALRAILIGCVAIRVVAALVVVAGPWTDDASELAGWDVARFQEIADAPGRAWVDHPVEYPPGSVVIIEAIAQDGVVETQRILAALSLAIDLGVALLLALAAGRRAAAAYLVLGLPLIPAGFVRFDLWSVALAVVAAIALVGSPGQNGPSGERGGSSACRETAGGRSLSFAVIVTAAALVKVWPALLVAGAVALGRRTAALAAVATMAIAGAAWLVYGGLDLGPVEQVVSLRGATGWHVESLGGTITALTSDAQPERQLNAFRIGRLNDVWVLAGRVVTIAVVFVLGWLVYRRHTAAPARADLELLALFMLGSTAALLVTAPLLSPQFLLWLTPWAAIAGARAGRLSYSVLLTGAATLITGAVLTYFGPPNVAETTPAALLLVRNLVLVALIPAVAIELARSGGAEDPLGNRSAGPRPARAEPKVDEVPDEPAGLSG